MIRLHELSLQAFRGIPGTLSLNLSAPVTLIYAPNGTGKTTICEAAEWLLTGSIKRLEAPDSDGEQIRCKFSPDSISTIVSATINVDGETICLERKLDGCRWRIGDGRWKSANQSALLEKLAPSAIEQGVHRGHANPSRQIWLKGSRFLSGDTLSALLDSDGESIKSRQQLFADLLGVGHLLETERQLDGYIEEIGHPLREQQNRVDDKEKAIKEREAKVATQAENGRGDLLAVALDYIRSAHELLGVKQAQTKRPTRSSVLSTISALRADLEGRKLQWNDKRQAELRIAPDWPQRGALEQSLMTDQTRLVVLTTEATDNETNVARANGQLLDLNSQALQLTGTIDAFENQERELGAVQTQAQPLITQYLQKLRVKDLSADSAFAIVDSEGTERTRAIKIAKLREILSALPAILSQRQDLNTLKSAYEAMSVNTPSSEAVASLRSQAAVAGEHVSALRAAYERAAGPLDQIRHLARTITEALGHDETACPVCAHHWKTPSSLRRAIAAAAEGTPASLALMAQQLRDAEAKAQQLQNQLLNQNQQLVRAVETERNYRALELAFAAFSAKVREAGIEADDTELQTKIDIAIARINLVPVLRMLRDELATTQKMLSTSLAAKISVLNIHTQFRPLLLNAITAAKAGLAAIEQQRQPFLTVLAAGAEAATKIATEREGLERRIHQNGSRIQILRSGWQTLAGVRVWSDKALSEISAALRQDRETQQKAERALVQAETVLRNLADIEELTQLRAQLVPLIPTALKNDRCP
jgi:DNA repair exonuclease SbcCD ATPase subunit